MDARISDDRRLPCPFAVVVDTREQHPYSFQNIPPRLKPKATRVKKNGRYAEALASQDAQAPDQAYANLAVPVVRRTLPVGDYSIAIKQVNGLGQSVWSPSPPVVVERKSLDDLYGSVARRENFISRLERMNNYDAACVVVEEEWSFILRNPSPFANRITPKNILRTIIAWQQRYPKVHWWFMPGRAAAEALTFRYLERFHLDWTRTSGFCADGSVSTEESVKSDSSSESDGGDNEQ